MSAPVERLTESELRKLCGRQQGMLAMLQAKVLRQRAWINRLITAEDHCIYRIEAELLREELSERNTPERAEAGLGVSPSEKQT